MPPLGELSQDIAREWATPRLPPGVTIQDVRVILMPLADPFGPSDWFEARFVLTTPYGTMK
ncbi:hypothetical protein LCGC14_2920160, partial [marine sediment metagenome]